MVYDAFRTSWVRIRLRKKSTSRAIPTNMKTVKMTAPPMVNVISCIVICATYMQYREPKVSNVLTKFGVTQSQIRLNLRPIIARSQAKLKIQMSFDCNNWPHCTLGARLLSTGLLDMILFRSSSLISSEKRHGRHELSRELRPSGASSAETKYIIKIVVL